MLTNMKCNIVEVGKRRDGGYRYWCLSHGANATAKYGRPADECVAAQDEVVRADQIFDLVPSQYPGGVGIWGAVPAVYNTTKLPVDRGVHVHARLTPGGSKDIDATYRRVRVPFRSGLLMESEWAVIDEIDAINYMVSTVLGFSTKFIKCTLCGFPHLDRDWFAVHVHRRHQCHGCGRQFSDSEFAIGNPTILVQEQFEVVRPSVRATTTKLSIKQKDYPGGIAIWGSNPAIVWTASNRGEDTGIHVHAYKREGEDPMPDGTFSQVEIDGISLNPDEVRVYMAQSAMPHLEGRIVYLECPDCGMPHFDKNELAYTPHMDHCCDGCGAIFRAPTQMKKTIGNPFVLTRKMLAQFASNELREDKLGFRPETI
jgi:hypothetical protein